MKSKQQFWTLKSLSLIFARPLFYSVTPWPGLLPFEISLFTPLNAYLLFVAVATLLILLVIVNKITFSHMGPLSHKLHD